MFGKKTSACAYAISDQMQRSFGLRQKFDTIPVSPIVVSRA